MKTRLSGFPVFGPDAIQPESRLFELYHENSKLRPGLLPDNLGRPVVLPSRAPRPRRYPHASLVPLPAPKDADWKPVSWLELVELRRTCRRFNKVALSLKSIAAILHSAYGNTQARQHVPNGSVVSRPSPSAGALYPLEVYAAINHCDGPFVGLHHYDPDSHQLARLSKESPAAIIENICLDGAAIHDAPLILIITAIFQRTTLKYGDRGYRYVLLEVGHVAQNVVMTAAALGLASFPIGGFVDDKVNAWLGIDGVNEATCYMIGIGEQMV